MAGFESVPGHLGDIDIGEAQAVGGILQDVAHGQLAGRGQAGKVLQQRIAQEIGHSGDPVAKPNARRAQDGAKRVISTLIKVKKTTNKKSHNDFAQCHHLDIQGL
ncbi:hypothetical protein PRtIB026_A29680 [Pseudomonas sp. RtIB026]|nr:hypothetical protein PRtIB026_A29680 [Pseudomonas sp. RtIB026]